MSNAISFSAFADLHYKKGMYVAGIQDINEIFARAKQDNSELVLQLGDMCNDYIRSAELINAYIYRLSI